MPKRPQTPELTPGRGSWAALADLADHLGGRVGIRWAAAVGSALAAHAAALAAAATRAALDTLAAIAPDG